MIRTTLIAGLMLLGTPQAFAREPTGPWVRLMTWEGSAVGLEARPAAAVDDGLETSILIVWRAPQSDGGGSMQGRIRVDCGTRQASVMEAVSRSLSGQELSRETRDAPNWGDGPPGTPVAALIGVLCDGALVEDGPVYADAAAFVAATREAQDRALPPPVPVVPAR